MELVLKSSTILFVALCAVRLLRRQSAATRHLVLTVGLISSLTVPFLGSVLPKWHVGAAGVYGKWVLTPLAEQDGGNSDGISFRGRGQTPFFVNPAPLRQPVPLPLVTVTGIWVVGAGMAGLILAAGGARIRWLTLRSKPLAGIKWESISTEVAHRLNLKRQVRLLRNNRGVLGTWGLLRPRILLPADAETWPDARLRVVLTHELAHIKRFDWPVQILAECARAIYWFNPLFWIACRRLRSESEHACDDVVLNAGFEAKEYAAQLLDLARTLKSSDRKSVV